ncbi:MAG: hypothetical protein ACE5OR_11905 [bacterium]
MPALFFGNWEVDENIRSEMRSDPNLAFWGVKATRAEVEDGGKEEGEVIVKDEEVEKMKRQSALQDQVLHI